MYRYLWGGGWGVTPIPPSTIPPGSLFSFTPVTGISICSAGSAKKQEVTFNFGLGDKPIQFSSVAQLCLTLCDPINHSARPPCPSPTPTPGVYPNSCPLCRWYHPTISSSVVSFSSCPQSFLASGSFQMSQLFPSGGQSTGVSASASVLPMNTQDWSPLGWTGWISLQSKGLSRVFSNTTVQKHQFFGTQLSL